MAKRMTERKVGARRMSAFKLGAAKFAIAAAASAAMAFAAMTLAPVDARAQDASAYADQVTAYRVGSPAPDAAYTNAQNAVGAPNYQARDFSGFVSLGCKGELTLRFTNNSLMDGEGDDLQIVEVGPKMEATQVFVSRDGANWIKLGKLKGRTKSIDMKGKVEPGVDYPFVRLVDASKKNCKEETAGADIDAVAALNGGAYATVGGGGIAQQQTALIKPPDRDGDGHIDASFRDGAGRALGDDCDDGDANRFPGNVEVADTANHDEDCDSSTYGALDADGDGYASNSACNVDASGALICGPDCDDGNAAVNPRNTPSCDAENTAQAPTSPQAVLGAALETILPGAGAILNPPGGQEPAPDQQQEPSPAPTTIPGIGGQTNAPINTGEATQGPQSVLAPRLDSILAIYFTAEEVLEITAIGTNLPNTFTGKMRFTVDGGRAGGIAAEFQKAQSYALRVFPGPSFRDAVIAKPSGAARGTYEHEINSAVISFQIRVMAAPDRDGDGHMDASIRDGAGRTVGDDCDDGDANRFPGNLEVVDAGHHDEDCDPTTFGVQDIDGDGFTTSNACNYDQAGALQCATDCNDNDPHIHRSAPESCDGVDNNCDGQVDEPAVCRPN
jgi:hypothetical protein